MGKVAELLDLRIDDLWLLLQKLGIRYSILNEEVEEELDAYRRIFEKRANTRANSSSLSFKT